MIKTGILTVLLYCFAMQISTAQKKTAGNPIITNKFTADPAALVDNGTVYIYTGHDEAPVDKPEYVMNEWLCFSSQDMVNWKEHPVPLSVKDFKWAKGDAWASQVIKKGNKYYWYVAVEHGTVPGKSIGVAVSDSPTGPFTDARGSAIITNDMTIEQTKIFWDDIDPTVYVDDDGQAYLFWGNTACYYAKLKDNMIDLDGPIHHVPLPKFTEAPYIHKRNGWYYLTYSMEFPEKTVYAMSRKITGPWEFKGIINEIAGNCNTNHHAIIDFKGKTYFVYHNGALVPNAASYHRSVCIDELYYNADDTIKRIVMTTEGVEAVR